MSQILYQLSHEDLAFPSIVNALTDPNGLLAIGGDLSVERLLTAYTQGIFPWFSEGEPIMWWFPKPRAIIHINQLYINKTLRKYMRKQPYKVTLNYAFEEVISYCADAPFRHEGTWITEDMLLAYTKLHQQGHAHSIEVWEDETLVGGLYGVAINGFFSGESMFYKKTNASKIALVALGKLLQGIGVNFIDCQINNDFLASMGCKEVTISTFLSHKKSALQVSPPDTFWLPQNLIYAVE